MPPAWTAVSVAHGAQRLTKARIHGGSNEVAKLKEGDEAKVVTRVRRRGTTAIIDDEGKSDGGLLDDDDKEGHTNDVWESMV